MESTQARFPSLDRPGSASLGQWTILIAGAVILVITWSLAVPDDQSTELVVPGVSWIFAGVLGACAGVSAVILYGQAVTTHSTLVRRLGGGMLFLSLMTPWMLIAAPSTISSGVVEFGNASSAQYLLIFSASGLFATFAVAAAMDEQCRRRGAPAADDQRSKTGIGVLISAAAAVATGATVVLAADSLPPLVDPSGATVDYPLVTTLRGIVWAVALIALWTLWPGIRRRSRLHVWLAAVVISVSLALFLQAQSTQNFDIAWYAARGLAVLTSIAIVYLLVSHLLSLQAYLQGQVHRADFERDRADAAQEQAIRLASTDPLTGLANRVGFATDVPRVLAELPSPSPIPAQRHSHPNLTLLASIDIERFKDVNSRLGHAMGNLVLQTVARRLNAALSGEDLVFRMAGDQFAVLLTDVPEVGDALTAPGGRLAEILGCFTDPISVDSATVHLRASLGYAIWQVHARDPDRLLNQSELALYAAKSSRRGVVVRFDETLESGAHQQLEERALLESDIRDSSYFYHYQPIQDLRNGGLWGVEALLRCDRNGRMLSAAEFLPQAERTGLLTAITHAALAHLEADLPALVNRLGPKGTVTINVSPEELLDDRIVSRLAAAPFTTWVNSLMLELTEDAALDSVKAQANLTELRRLGYSLAIDDLGTGYSNFSSLVGLRPALVKIDRGLIPSGMAGESSEQQSTFVAAAQAMAVAIGAESLAEGIETDEQLSAIARLGVDLGQGYGIARPMALNKLQAWTPQLVT